jgi:molybdate transport system substrate-binding protein
MKILIFLLLFPLCLEIHSQTVRVAAASSLRYVLADIKTKYLEMNPHVTVEISLGATGALTQQIIHGAPFDFFMAADASFPRKLQEDGCTVGEIKTYGLGRLVLWSNTLDVSKGLKVLTGKKFTRIALAKPEIAPYGKAAMECLKFNNLFEALQSKLIYADNVSQAAQFAATGNAEASFTAYSLVLGPELRNKGYFFVPDPGSYKPVEQTCVILKNSKDNTEALKFMNFILSGTCKPLFEKYGFEVPH